MEAELKTKWISALRSGKYQQCIGGLKNKVGYCCLGVLTDIVDSTKWEQKNLSDGTSDVWYIYNDGSNNFNDAYLPKSVEDICKLDIYKQHEVAKMNDGGKTFVEIADHIEKNL
jgi:hypothetical protein